MMSPLAVSATIVQSDDGAAVYDEVRLIDDIYAVALDPARWVGVMETLADAGCAAA